MTKEHSTYLGQATRQLWRQLIMALTLLTIGLLIFLVYRAKTAAVYRPTRMDFTKIKHGMTESEVEAILGPPHEILVNPRKAIYRIDHKVLMYYGAAEEWNHGKTIIIDVMIDDESRVLNAGLSTESKRSVLQTIMDWLQ